MSDCPDPDCIEGYVYYKRDLALPMGPCGHCQPDAPYALKLRKEIRGGP